MRLGRVGVLMVGLAAALGLARGAGAQQPKPAPAAGPVAGQVGTGYPLRTGFSLAILSARYSIEPFVANDPVVPGTGEKLLVLEIAVRNNLKMPFLFNGEGLLSVLDDQGEVARDGTFALQSRGVGDPNLQLQPGQGLGQPQLKDPLRVAFVLPGKVKVSRIVLNKVKLAGRDTTVTFPVGPSEKLTVAPLPEAIRDPADPTGATKLDEGKGTAGTFLTSACFGLRLDGFSYSSEPLVRMTPPDEGMKYAVALVTARALCPRPTNIVSLTGGDTPLYEVEYGDGVRERRFAFREAKRDAEPLRDFKRGDEFQFRVVFQVPKDATVKSVILAADVGQKWAVPVQP